MGFYLPSEVSRLVLSYLLDHDLQDTSAQFLEECPFLQELRQVSPEDLEDYTRVNGRSLMEILREYKTLLKTISSEYKQINPNNSFEAPQRMLDLVLEKRKTTPSQPQNKSKKTTPTVTQPIRPKPFPGFTPNAEKTQNKRRSLQSAGTPLLSATPLQNITINLPTLSETEKKSQFGSKLKSPVKKAQATSANEPLGPNSLVINTDANDAQNEDEVLVSSTSKTKSSTNSHGKIGSRKGKKPVRRGTKTDQTDDEFLADLLGKPIAEMLGESVMTTKGQDQDKAISDVATNILTPSLLGLLSDVVDLDQLPRPKNAPSASDSVETESRLSTPELIGSAEESVSETAEPSAIMPSLKPSAILPSLPQTPLPMSELGGTSTLSTIPPTFIMPSSSSSTPASSSKLLFLQPSSDNTITLTPGTVQYQQFADALSKIPSMEDLPKEEVVDLPKEEISSMEDLPEQADPLAQLISDTITNTSPNEPFQAAPELDLTNVPVDIVGKAPTKTRKRKLSTPKHLGAGKKSKSNEVTEDKATTVGDKEADKQILDKFQIQLQAVIGAEKPVAKTRKSTRKVENPNAANSVLEQVAKLSKIKGPLGKENFTVAELKESEGPKMLILTPISREEIQRKEAAKRQPQVIKSPRSPHIRNLVFSPPSTSNEAEKASLNLKTPEKKTAQSGVKILSPGPAASPLRRTDSSWNREIKIMFREESPCKGPPAPLPGSGDPSAPLPTSPLPLSEISLTPTSTAQPSVEALTKSLEASISSEVAIRKSSPGRIPDLKATPKRCPINAAETTPTIIPRKILIPITMPTATPAIKDATPKVTSAKKLEKKKLQKSPTMKPSWDERIRGSLGALETNMDHISKRYSDNSPGRRRRSPRKKRKQKASPSHEFSDEDDSPPEIQLEDGKDVSPDSQKILDYLQKSLLEQLEKGEVGPDSSDSDEDEKDNAVLESPHMPILANSPNKTLQKQATKTLNRAITSVVATKKNPKSKKKSSKKEEPAVIIEKKLEPIENASETVKQESGQESDTNILTMHTIDPETTIDLLSQPVIFPNPDDAKFKTPKKADNFTFKTPRKSPVLLHLDESPRRSPKRGNSPEKSSSPPRTPRTSRTPHIPVSPFNLLSPAQRKRAVPLTPSRSARTRHESTLDTPVLKSPGESPGIAYPLAPTTPRGNKTPSAPYYTPSPSTRDSFPSPGPRPGDTPGLQFLLEEGQKLSGQSEDSMSPAKASGKRSCRKSFRNMFKKSSAEDDLGTILEKQISKYSFDHKELQENNYATFKSPDAGRQRSDYTSSPHILLRPSSTQASPVQVAAADGNASFVSPNRTCYLSPTAMAMSSSFLGLDYNKPPLNSTFPAAETSEIQSTINADEFTEAQSSILEEASEISEEMVGSCGQPMNLSDTEQSADFSKMTKSNLSDDKNIKFPVLELSEDSNSGDDEGTGSPNISQINRRGNTFIEAFQEVKKKNSAAKEIQTELKKPPVKWSPRKPRRMTLSSLKSSSRLSTLTLTNDSSSFEAQFDVHNLDAFQTSVQNYSEDTSSSMDSQFESPPPTPIQTQPKRKTASPKKTPSSPTLTVKITSKKMEEKWKSAEKLKRKSEKEDVKVGNKNEVKNPMRAKRCNACAGCTREDCGTCEMCKDRTKFGGPNKKKQACLRRLCLLNNTEAKKPTDKVTEKKDDKKVEEKREKADVKGTKRNAEEKNKAEKSVNENVKKKEEEVTVKVGLIDTRKVDKNAEKVTTRKSNTQVEKEDKKESKEDTRKNDKGKEINASNLGKTGTKKCDEKHVEVDSTRSRSTKNKEEISNKNQRGRSKDSGDSKSSSGTSRRGRSNDNKGKEVVKRFLSPPSDDEFVLDIVESSTAKAKQNWAKDSKKDNGKKGVNNKNPPIKSIDENLVKLNQELTLQFSPRKPSPPTLSGPPSPVPEVYSAVGLVRSPSKRKAETPPQSLPAKSIKLVKTSEELSHKNVQINKEREIEITPNTSGVSCLNIPRVLSPNIVSPPRTRKALASYSPKKAKKEDQRRDSPQKPKEGNPPPKLRGDFIKNQIDNLSPRNKSETLQKEKSDVSQKKDKVKPVQVDLLAASAMQIIKNISLGGKVKQKAQETKSEATIEDDISILPDQQEPDQEEQGGSIVEEQEQPTQISEEESVPQLEVSEMFIFQESLPFGVFEDDL